MNIDFCTSKTNFTASSVSKLSKCTFLTYTILQNEIQLAQYIPRDANTYMK